MSVLVRLPIRGWLARRPSRRSCAPTGRSERNSLSVSSRPIFRIPLQAVLPSARSMRLKRVVDGVQVFTRPSGFIHLTPTNVSGSPPGPSKPKRYRISRIPVSAFLT